MKRRYNPIWEYDHTWLTFKNGFMFCTLCLCKINTIKKHNVVAHERSAKHQKKEELARLSGGTLRAKHTNLSFEESAIEVDDGLNEITEELDTTSDISPQSKKKRNFLSYRKLCERNPTYKDWLAPVEDDPDHVYCKICFCSITAERHSLVSHSKSKKHLKSLERGPIPGKTSEPSQGAQSALQNFVITIDEKLLRGPLLVEGKKKRIFSVIANPALVVIEFKEAEKERYSQSVINDIHCKLFKYMNQSGFPTSFLKAQTECSYSSRKCDIIPLAFVVRRIASGDFCAQNLDVSEGYQFQTPRVEMYSGDSEMEMTLMTESEIIDASFTVSGIDIEKMECQIMQKTAITAFEILERGFKSVERALVELKLHFGVDNETKDIVISDLDVEGNGLHLWTESDQRIHKGREVEKGKGSPKQVNVQETVDLLQLEPQGLVVVVADSCEEDRFCDKVRRELIKKGFRVHMRQGSTQYNTESTLNMISEYNDMDIPIVFIATTTKSATLGAFISSNTIHSVITCPDLDNFNSTQFKGMGCPAMKMADAIQYVGKLLAPADHVFWSKERGRLLNNWRKILQRDRAMMNRSKSFIIA